MGPGYFQQSFTISVGENTTEQLKENLVMEFDEKAFSRTFQHFGDEHFCSAFTTVYIFQC